MYKVIDGTWKTNIKLDGKFKDIKPIEYRATERTMQTDNGNTHEIKLVKDLSH